MNYQYAITTPAGVSIRFRPSQLVRAEVVKQGQILSPEWAVRASAPTDLVSTARDLGASLVMASVQDHGDTCTATVVARGRTSLSAVTVDVGDLSVRPWLEVAVRCGYLPLVLDAGSELCVVHANVGPELPGALRQRTGLRQMREGELVEAMSWLIQAIDSHFLAPPDQRLGRLTHADLSLCLGPAPLGDAQKTPVNGGLH